MTVTIGAQGIATFARQRAMERPRQRLACDRCHALKLRCPRTTGPDGNSAATDCARCIKAGSLCIYSPQARLGRPLGSTASQSSSSAPSGGAANGKRQASRCASSASRDEPNSRPARQMEAPNHGAGNNHGTAIASTTSSSSSSRDPSMPLGDILSDDFFSNLATADADGTADVWISTAPLPGNHDRSMTAHNHLTSGALQSPFSPHDASVHDLAVAPERQYQLQNHNPNRHHHHHHHRHHQHHHQPWEQQQQQQQQYKINSGPPKHTVGAAIDKCAACSVAILPEPMTDDEIDPVQDVLSQLSSLTVSIHSHSLNVHSQLLLLRTRLNRLSGIDDDTQIQPLSTNELVVAVNDCLSIQALIRTNHSLRDIIRQMKRTKISRKDLPSLTDLTYFGDASGVAAAIGNTRSSVGAIPSQSLYTPISNYSGMSGEQKELLNDPNYCSLNSPNSCRLALTLALNCYLEILDIYTMTFSMISTTISHHRSNFPINATTASSASDGSDNMLDASYSIFTATQITTRLLDMVKADMRDAWERYRSSVLTTPGEEGMDAQRKSEKPNPAIQMSFRLSWEKEAVIARLVEEIEHRLNTLMDLT